MPNPNQSSARRKSVRFIILPYLLDRIYSQVHRNIFCCSGTKHTLWLLHKHHDLPDGHSRQEGKRLEASSTVDAASCRVLSCNAAMRKRLEAASADRGQGEPVTRPPFLRTVRAVFPRAVLRSVVYHRRLTKLAVGKAHLGTS